MNIVPTFKVDRKLTLGGYAMKTVAGLFLMLFSVVLVSGLQAQTPTPLPTPFISTTELAIDSVTACEIQSDASTHDCFYIKAVVDANDPSVSFDDALDKTNVVLVVRKAKTTPWNNRWVVLESGGNGRGYGITFGGVPPGEYIADGVGYGDDLIRWYNDIGYITLDVVWECAYRQVGSPCYNTSLAGWVRPYSKAATGWFRNTGGAGYVGASSRTRAILQWAMANNGGSKVYANGHSSGSGRLMTTLTRYNGASLLYRVVFDGGPVFAYIPWYCGITDDGDPSNGIVTPGPLGPKPPQYDIEAYSPLFRDNYDDARDKNNGTGLTPYKNCTDHVWDEAGMMEDSNFSAPSSSRDLAGVKIGVVLGGKDASPASAHARLWFQGYGSVPPLSATYLAIWQGYCADVTSSSLKYTANTQKYPCTDWDKTQFPTADFVWYPETALNYPSLANVGHDTAKSKDGAMAIFLMMSDLCGESCH